MFGRLTVAVSAIALGASIAQAAPEGADPALVEKGRALAVAGDCTSCHSNPKTGDPFSGGYGVASPLGVIYGANITPDPKTGIGGWSLSQFSDAVRKGRAPDGRLYPAMPYTAFSGVADDDIKAMYSYFMLGVPAVAHDAPKTALAFPYNMRWLMAFWDVLFGASGGKPVALAPQSGIARGKYLAETLAHCSTCHTPRGLLMNEETGQFLAGGKVGSWTAPNITSDPIAGIGGWSEAEIVTFLKTGYAPGKAIAAGEMGLAVQNSFSKMSEDDLRAIAAYLKTVPPRRGSETTPRSGGTRSAPIPAAELERPLDTRDYKALISIAGMSGAQIYSGACATCHGHDGRGTPDKVLPSLVGASTVGSSDPSNLVMTIRDGVNRRAGHSHAFMPAFATELSTQQLAAVADYVSTSFGNPAHRVSEQDVARVYAAAGQSNWLIANAGTMIWTGLAALAAALGWVVARRRSRKGA